MPPRRIIKDQQIIAHATADFVAMVSHQLKGPLGGIRAASAMLAAGDYGALPPKAKSTVQLMGHTTARLISLIDTYLSSTRLDLGSFEVQLQPTDLRAELEELEGVMAPLAKLKGLALKLHVPAKIAPVVTDGRLFSNIAFNLIDNAIAYTEQGAITVRLRVTRPAILLSVIDTGVGMDPKDAGRLFKKFQRGVMGEAMRHKGTGLGLFLVKRLVHALGGTVEAKSKGMGKGSTFEVRLPRGR